MSILKWLCWSTRNWIALGLVWSIMCNGSKRNFYENKVRPLVKEILSKINSVHSQNTGNTIAMAVKLSTDWFATTGNYKWERVFYGLNLRREGFLWIEFKETIRETREVGLWKRGPIPITTVVVHSVSLLPCQKSIHVLTRY